LRYRIRLFIWDLSVLLMYALMAITINFPLKTDFSVSHGFWQVVFSFSLASRNLRISPLFSTMTHWSLSNVLFSLQLFVFSAVVFVVEFQF
jgi:hypothetical protein